MAAARLAHSVELAHCAGCWQVDDRGIANAFARRMGPLEADLVDIAAEVHCADRLTPRARFGRDGWSRPLDLAIPVRRPEFWGDPSLAGGIERLLGFLTDDKWNLRFGLRRDEPRASESQGHLAVAESDPPAWVGLFSGGLDSLAGAAGYVWSRPGRLALVSGAGNFRQLAAQRRQADVLRRLAPGRVQHVCVPYGHRWPDGAPREQSGRSRGFLFLAFGAVAAMQARCNRLLVFENGVGAINLPYDESQMGADHSRAVHPRALRE